MAGSEGRRRRGRPALVSREDIVRAALDRVDRGGLDGLTMAAVARALGVGVMTLYHHVADKADLIAGMVDLAAAEHGGAAEADSWRERCLDQCRRLRAALLRHPALAEATLQRAAIRPQNLHDLEDLLALCVAQGIPADVALQGLRTAEIYTLGCVLWELPRRSSDGGDYRQAVRDSVRALPADDFPLLLGLTEVLVAADFDAQFESGLAMVLDQLERQAHRSTDAR